MMELDNAKVAVDREITEKIPTVAVALPPDSVRQKKKKETQSQSVAMVWIRTITGFVIDFLETIVVALSIFVVVYLFLVQPHEVKGSSMEPTFHNNEYILTDKISYRFRKPMRGDVVIFKAPKNPEVDYIKRIIALPGETITIENEKVFVNGEQIEEPYISTAQTSLFPGSTIIEGEPFTMPHDAYFMMGDNRSHSSDSREFGAVERNLIIGRAVLRYWPPTVFGPIPSVTYANLPTVDTSP